MKQISILIALLLFTFTAAAQLKGDYSIWAKTPQALKKKQLQLEYKLEKINVNNPGNFYYRDSGAVKSRELNDYTGYSYLGFNLRYGITDRLEVATELNHTQYPDFTPKVFNKFTFGTPTLQLKYQVNKKYFWKSKLAVFGGAMFDVFDNTTRFNLFDTTEIYEFPFTNWYHLGVRIETKLRENFVLRYGGAIYRRYTEILTFSGVGKWFWDQDFSLNAQYIINENLGVFGEYTLAIFGGAEYQFGAYYNINKSTQVIGIYNRDLVVKNKPYSDNYTLDVFKLGIYKTF